jgi:MFS family permease
LPIVLTIIGDIFVLEERAKVQGLFSGVWAMSSIVGPALGGLIVDHLSWRWVFYLNIPFGLLSALLLIIYFREKVERKKVVLDYIGTLTLSGGVWHSFSRYFKEEQTGPGNRCQVLPCLCFLLCCWFFSSIRSIALLSRFSH